tara:strand:+ start:5309 stop:5848 length:540 start_codon:yes stop_codon:yes gene_type:complete
MDLINNKDFSQWTTLNDTIMGGSSQGICKNTSKGLLLEGTLVEENGGFVSCRSPVFESPFNLSKFTGLLIEIEGEGRTLKLSISCEKGKLDYSMFYYPRVKWTAPLDTKITGISIIKVPFKLLQPVVRAKAVLMPVKFNSSCINQLQILYSKFGKPGELNPNFSSGPFKIVLRSIKAYE